MRRRPFLELQRDCKNRLPSGTDSIVAEDNDIFRHFHDAKFRLAAGFGRWMAKYWFRFEIRGLENMPDGPCLVVGNHSGLGIAEELMFVTTWADHFAPRRAWGLIHDFFFDMPIVGRYYRAIGAIPASQENARAALERGDVVLVFPGGDLDCFRPFYEPNAVKFGERRGYIRLALDMGVPVLPLATVGSHWTWTLLPGGRTLAKIPWIRRVLRTDCLPLPTIVFALAAALICVATGVAGFWVVGVTSLGLLPTPVRIRSQLCEPLQLGELTQHADDPVEAGHEVVHGSLLDAIMRPQPTDAAQPAELGSHEPARSN